MIKLILGLFIIFEACSLQASADRPINNDSPRVRVSGKGAVLEVVDVVFTKQSRISSEGIKLLNGTFWEEAAPVEAGSAWLDLGWIASCFPFVQTAPLPTSEGKPLVTAKNRPTIIERVRERRYKMPLQNERNDSLKNWKMTIDTKAGIISHTPDWVIINGVKAYRFLIKGEFLNETPLKGPLAIKVHMTRQQFLNAVVKSGLYEPSSESEFPLNKVEGDGSGLYKRCLVTSVAETF